MCISGISTHAIYNKFRFDVSIFLASGRYLILLLTVKTYRLILSFLNYHIMKGFNLVRE